MEADVRNYRNAVIRVFKSYYVELSSSLEGCMDSFADKAYASGLISDQVMKERKNFLSIFNEFKAGFNSKTNVLEVQKHYQCFIEILDDLGGPVAAVGKNLASELSDLSSQQSSWIKTKNSFNKKASGAGFVTDVTKDEGDIDGFFERHWKRLHDSISDPLEMAQSFYDQNLISQIYYDNVNMACIERDESAASVLLNGLRQTASLIGHITFMQIFISVIEEYDSLKEIAAIMKKEMTSLPGQDLDIPLEEGPSSTSNPTKGIQFDVHTSIYESSFLLAITLTSTTTGKEITLKGINYESVVELHNGDENLLFPINALRGCLFDVTKENGVCDVTVLLCGSDRTPMFQLHFLRSDHVGVLVKSLSSNSLQCHLSQKVFTQTGWSLGVSMHLYLVTPNIEKLTLFFRPVLQSNWEECVAIFAEGMIWDLPQSFQKKEVEAEHLTVHNLNVIAYELKDVSSEWFLLGSSLNVEQNILKLIEKQQGQHLKNMLKAWLRGHPDQTWNVIVTALHKIGHYDLAKKIADKYGCQYLSYSQVVPVLSHSRDSLFLASDQTTKQRSVTSSREEILQCLSEQECQISHEIDNFSWESTSLQFAVDSLKSTIDSVDVEIKDLETECSDIAMKLAKEEKKIQAIEQLKDYKNCIVLQEIIEEAETKIKDLNKRNQELQCQIKQKDCERHQMVEKLAKKNSEIDENKKNMKKLERKKSKLQIRIKFQRQAYELNLKKSKQEYELLKNKHDELEKQIQILWESFAASKSITEKEKLQQKIIILEQEQVEVLPESSLLENLHIDDFGPPVEFVNDKSTDEMLVKTFINNLGTKWSPPDVYAKDCTSVIFHVAIDFAHLNTELTDSFWLSILSKEIGDGKNVFFGKFNSIFQSLETKQFVLSCKLPIPDDFLWKKKYFRYKYAIFHSHSKRPKVESLKSDNFEWRVIEVKSGDQQMQFDFIIYQPLNDFHCIESGSIATFIEFGVNEKWNDIDISTIAQAISKGKQFSTIFKCLKYAKYCLAGGRITEEPSSNDLIEKVFIQKMGSLVVHCTNDLMKFCTGFVIVYALLRSKVLSMESYVKEVTDILSAFFIPVTEFVDYFNVIKNWKSHLRFFVEAVHPLYTVLINQPYLSYEWMKALPFLHIIALDSFEPFKPFTLPLTEQKIGRALFCGLDISKYRDLALKDSSFATKSYDLVKDYFDVDWLMPRAWVALCSLQELPFCLQHYPLVSPFVCSLLGSYKDSTETKELVRVSECIIVSIKERNINIDEEELCYSSVNTLLQEISSSKSAQTLELFLSLIKLFLTALDKLSWKEKDEYICQLSSYTKCWIEGTYGSEPNEQVIEAELKCWSNILETAYYNKILLYECWFKLLSSQMICRLDKLLCLLRVNLFVRRTDVMTYAIKNCHVTVESQPVISSNELDSIPPNKQMFELGILLNSKYPIGVDVNLQSVFDANWLKYLKIYDCFVSSTSSEVQTVEESLADFLCKQAIRELMKLFHDIENKSVTLKLMNEIKKAWDTEMFRCLLSLKLFEGIDFDKILLEINACHAYEENKRMLSDVLIQSDLTGEASAIDESSLKSEDTLASFYSLWKYEGESFYFQYGDVSVNHNLLKEIAALANHKRISKILCNIYSTRLTLNRHQNRSQFSILHNILEDLWKPIFEECKVTFHMLEDNLNLPLCKIHILFDGIDSRDLEIEINKWCDVFDKTDRSWIGNAVEIICQYKRVSCTVQILMQIKQLTEDTNTDTLLPSTGYEYSSDIYELDATFTLEAFGDVAKQMASIHADIVECPERKASLKMLCSSVQVIKCLKKYTKNFRQLWCVVQIAIKVMRKGQLFWNLLIFVLAYGPLIYDVTENFESLITSCKQLWKYIDKNHHLTTIAVEYCNSNMAVIERVLDDIKSKSYTTDGKMWLNPCYCVYCVKELVNTNEIFCPDCHTATKLTFPYRSFSSKGQKTVHCYNCGEELIKYGDKIICMNACMLIHMTNSEESDWIKCAIDFMVKYHELYNYHEPARALIKIRDTLQLTGDFSLVENIARQVSLSPEKQTLAFIEYCLGEAGKFLKTYAEDKRKKDCLEAFAECQNIVAWIKKETTDVTSLQNFVTVALATAAGGEGDVTTDKLLYLRNVGSGFGPLIYNLPRTTNYHQLQERCKTLWETLKHAPTLPEMMRTCEHEIDWYQSVKETQGSVEITSFGQMKNIITYGLYEIGTSRKGILTNRSEVIHLRLRQSKTKRIHKLQYTLDEVRDLESKLVLITGRESEEREEVDLFLDIFHSVCRIADVLISLQQSGNDKYIGWSMLFPCAIDNVVQVLKYQASEMEKDLENWKNELSDHKDQFYELNYFTTPQLLSLREELGQFKTSLNSTKPVKSEAMSLLQCLSREITSNLVKDEVQVVCAIIQEQELTESTFDRQTTSHSSYRQEAIIPVNLTTQNMSHNIFTPVTEINNETLSDNKISSMTSGVLEHIMETEKVPSGPQSRLNEDDLTDKQKAILANLKESYGYSRKLILLALERCAKSDIEEAVEAWCNEHEENFNFSDSDVDSDIKTDPYSVPSDDEQLQSEDENEVMAIDESSVIDLIEPLMNIEPQVKPHSKSLLPKVTIREQIPIDENHPVVKELMKAGFFLEECKTAAELYPDNTQKAMEYIMEDSEEFSELFPRSTSHDLIIEDSGMALEEERYNRQQSGVSYGFADVEIVCSDSSIKKYLSILELGMVLQQLSNNSRAPVNQNRPFSDILKKGEPNLLVATPDTVLKTVLSLYMEDDKLPFPTHEEVLICSEHTTDEEVTLLWKRAMGDPNHFRIFCLVHAELLSYQVCDKALRTLFEFSQGQKPYKLVIICSNEEEDKSHMISKLQLYRRPFTTLHSVQTFSQYLITHFINWPHNGLKGQRILASVVDPENSYVRVVKSERAGMGKSLYIQRLKEELQAKTRKGPHHVIIPVHGPKVTFDTIVQALKHPFEKMTDQDSRQAIIFHIDISPSVLRQVDSVLFSLLILQAVCDSQGRMWRCHPAHLYAIEVTVPKSEVKVAKCTISLLDILPTMECLSPRNVLQMLHNELDNSLKCSMDTGEFRSPIFQRVHQYLRRHVGHVPLDRFSYRLQSVEGKPIECLQILLSQCGVRDPSWSELRHFVGFLDTQLKNCENSFLCNEDIVGDVLSGLKTFVVKFMIRMSKDFATSSLKGEVATENEEVIVDHEQLEEYQIDMRKKWEQNYHPYLFFNEDGMSITFVGFNATRNGDLRDPVKNVVIEAAALTPQLYTGLQHNQVNLSENYQAWGKDIMIQKIGMVMGLEWSLDPDPTYVLTVDNVIKIMAIHMRFRCNIPVVIIGETGCGKTRLIRYMCGLAAQGCRQGGEHVKNMLIMKIHGGTTENDIVKKVEEAEEIAQSNRKDHEVDTVLFFDEANTTEAIGLIKEVMCDRRIHGRSIKADVKFIAACNPYRKHTDDMIKKLESAGLGFYVKATETQHKLGTIPLRELVYRVLDLPPSMRPLVYDFGQLNNATEKDYIRQIVCDRCQAISGVSGQVINAVADVLAWSQGYMREKDDECSFVSLRDIERVMIVFKHFCDRKHLFTLEVLKKAQAEMKPAVDEISRALILAVSVCYHARLQDRKEYEHGVVKQFKAPLGVPGRTEQFCNEIRWCQDVLLDNMKLGPNIAKNAALRENVFMMAICIELRIPLFLVGKPGSSKSLAKSIVADSMLGRSSEKTLMKEFNQVQIFSYQCSQLSTPESVIEVFNTAKSFQKKQDTTKYVSVVVLDEVGLAEDSPNLPLKALHPLLEDGTEGADDSQQIIEREERVAFIGISNWALDPAKMNRGVMVIRGDPDKNELELSARGICSNRPNDPVTGRLNPYFQSLAAAYKAIFDKQSKPFFGLRDFYSLIKMLYWMCEKSKKPPTGPQLQHAIKRNFGGLEDLDTYEIFKNSLKNIEDQPDLTGLSKEDYELLSPDCSPLGLIRKSLQTKETSWHGENRYLLFLTENYAALQVLKHYLHEEVGMTINQERFGLEENVPIMQRMEPFVLFGSSFPKDREYTQVCHNINQIKICMETGRTVILLNLENLYESLYDLLNQFYIHLGGGQRYVDLGLQTHRVKCRVHNDFKLILIAEKTTVYEKFPTPLINRLEKHFVLTETVLLDWQKEVLTKLTNWVHQFSKVNQVDTKFTEQDAFVGYQNDTPASVIFQATQQLHQERPEQDEESEEWKEAVLTRSKIILLQMASPDSLIRLHHTTLADDQRTLSQIYFSEQHHGSIVQFLVHHLHNGNHISGQCGLLIQVTTHSHLLSSQELNELCQHIDIREDRVLCFLLQEFDTEMDFSNKISPAFSQHNKKDTLLIIQCDSGHLFGDLIACARYRIDDEREKANYQWKKGQDFVHVLFIIHLPRQAGETDKHSSSFVGFQGGSWISAHIDDIRAPLKTVLTLNDALSAPISDLFYNRNFLSYKRERESRRPGKGNVNLEIEDLESLEINEQSLNLISEQNMETLAEQHMMEEEMETEDLDQLNSQFYEDVSMETNTSPVTKPSRVHHSQCYRLYNCIQAAVARMVENDDTRKDWAARRVRLLFSLIPQNPTYPLDDHTFYGALVKHIRNVLKERDTLHQDKEWVLKEALSGQKLQIGGTFQNVLERRLDEIIVPIFAAILSFTDHYSNLDLIKPSHPRQEEVNPLQQLWLQIFSDDKLCQFSYESFSIGRGIEYHDFQSAVHKVGTPGVAAMERFSCQFPFFWLVKEAIDSKLESVKHTAGGHRQGVHTQLCEILTDTPVASILNEVSEEHWIEFYQLYFHDYLRSVHLVTYENEDMAKKEYEIIRKALHAIITGPDFIGGLSSFLSQLAAVHVVYYQYEQEIMWFGQLTTHIPGILVQLDKAIEEYSSQYMELPLYAVKVAINENNLALPLGPEKRNCIPQRLIKLQLCQNSIESILTLGQPTELTKEIRLSWQHVRAIQLFIEHIAIKCSLDDNRFIEFVQYANRIEIVLKTQSDFTKVETILGLQKLLRILDRDTGKKLKYASNMQKKVRDCCKSFFMEVVSSLCFGQPNPPEPALIKELLTVVFTEQDKTKDFSYSDKEKVDKVPVIRSFLLQLLLEHNTEIVIEHLEDYFTRSQQIIKDDRSLCLLCIQCFEDVLHKQYSYIHDKVRHAHQVMNEGIEVIMSSPAPSVEGSIHLQYLEGIAKLRYAIVVVAELLHCQHGASSRHQSYYTYETQLLLDATKRCCNNDIINTDNSGPGVFIVKQLARQYGVSFLTNLTSDQTMQWIVPHHLQRSNEDQQTNDPFVIYQVYVNLRTTLTDAVYGKELDKLQKTTEGLSAKDAPALLLGIYQVITGSCVFTDESKKVIDEIRTEITKRCKILNRSLMWTAQALIDNTYCGRLEPMLLRPGMSPQNRLLTDLIIHVVTALQSKEKLVILQPFIKMMNSPGELKGAYLPTMPEHSLPIVRIAIGGAFYECPRGHPYFVSECGKPTQRYNCPQCGSAIGGQNHQLTSGNRTARTTDTTETGYALGRPDQRETVPSSERTLSPAACAIVRVLMHTSLLWASCNNEHTIEGLIDLTKAQVRPADLPFFFWQHLQCDIDILSQALGKSKDESCLILHMILKDIVTEERNISTGVSTYATLGSRNARTEWERCFNNIYIEPILNKLEMTLQQATHLLVNDKKEDRDRLFYVIHERMSVAPKDILPHLWTYRSRITLEHLFQTLQIHKDTCPILHEFIQQEPLLRATQYLPGIVKLQQQMYELSHRRLDKTDVAQYTIGEFIRELGKGSHTELKRNQFREKLDCVRNAWSLVKDKLKEHSRVPVDSEYLTRVTWDESLPLSYLIPTLTGPGVCTVALIDLLVEVHNDFIEKCRSQLKKKQKKDIMWREHKVPVSHIQHCHLLEYEHQLISIVLSHCHYSLEHGKGQNVTYDLPALEKHVVDRFIHGKPLIQLEIPQVVYRKDVYTAETFANIRKNVSPQIKLSARQQTEIVTELRTMQSLRECLDVVEIVIGFLSSGRTDANTELKKYVKKVLKMERKFTSKKAMEYCSLGHILSLWETISVQIAKTLTLSRQEPFDSLGQDFLQILDKDVDKELRRFLRQVDIPPLLNLLYEFIETNVRHRNPDEKEWLLIDTLVAHLDNYGLEGLPPQFEEQFPQTITAGQAVATWKAIVFYQQQHEHDIKD